MSADACRRCGCEEPGDTRCSRCGGHGLVTGMGGDPTDCRDCWGAGVMWPPRCPRCAAFRKAPVAAAAGSTP